MEPQNLKVTDAHCHFFSHTFFRALLSQRPKAAPPTDHEVTAAVEGLGLEAPPQDPVRLAKRWVSELDRHGVCQAVLIASVPGDWPAVAEAVRAYPGRFAGYTMIDPKAPDATRTAQRLLTDHGFRLYDPGALKVVEAAAEQWACLEAAGTGRDALEAIFGGNARRLLARDYS